MARCDNCLANKVCDHNRFGFENCGSYISAADAVPKSEVEELIKSVDDMLDLVCTMTGLELTYYGKYTEFKKKYTEGEG